MLGVGVWISTGLRCIHIYIQVNVTPGHAYAGTEGRKRYCSNPSTNSALEWGGWSADLQQWETWYPLYRRLGGPQGQSGWAWKILLLPINDPWTIQPVVTIMSTLSWRPRIDIVVRKYTQFWLGQYIPESNYCVSQGVSAHISHFLSGSSKPSPYFYLPYMNLEPRQLSKSTDYYGLHNQSLAEARDLLHWNRWFHLSHDVKSYNLLLLKQKLGHQIMWLTSIRFWMLTRQIIW